MADEGSKPVKAGEQGGAGVFRRVKVIGLIVLIGLVVIVAFQNMGQASFQVLFWSVKMPLAAMLLLAFLVGGLAGAGGYMLKLKKK
jgi:uncharacterized integral membrane protein